MSPHHLERREMNIELVERVHNIELCLAKKIGDIKTDITVLNNKIENMMSSVNKLQKTFYGTFIAIFLTYIVDTIMK